MWGEDCTLKAGVLGQADTFSGIDQITDISANLHDVRRFRFDSVTFSIFIPSNLWLVQG